VIAEVPNRDFADNAAAAGLPNGSRQLSPWDALLPVAR
jgi:hypothetical protein